MRNLQVYDGETFAFYKKVSDKKKNPKDDSHYKDRLQLLENTVLNRYKCYDEHYSAKELQNITEVMYSDQEKNDLLKLYKYSFKAITDLKIKLTTTNSNRINNVCQNCSIGEIGSFDHYLPKEKFPEFSVNPKNLIPSCAICNGHKSQNWQENSKRLFLSPYQDILPNQQFLFILVEATPNDLNIEFIIDNRNNIDQDLYEIIESHYTKLYLCERFKTSCENAITEIKTEILSYSRRMPLNEVKDTIIENANDNRTTYGYNHFKYLLQIELINNRDFLYKYIGVDEEEVKSKNENHS